MATFPRTTTSGGTGTTAPAATRQTITAAGTFPVAATDSVIVIDAAAVGVVVWAFWWPGHSGEQVYPRAPRNASDREVPPLHGLWEPKWWGPGTAPAVLLALLAWRYAARVADRLPWRPLLLASYAVGLAVLVWSPSVPVFLLAALIFGVGTGLNSPTLYAWTIDLSHPERRGRAVATMYIALEAGIGLGALLAGWIFGNVAARLPYVHALSTACTLLALAYLLWGVRARPALRPE